MAPLAPGQRQAHGLAMQVTISAICTGGAFITYLLARHRRRIRAITTAVRE